MRRISFALTEQQFLDGSKDVTRRLGWRDVKPGQDLLIKVNAYGLRSTDPKRLWQVEDPVGADNVLAINVYAREARLFVAAWGNNIRERDAAELRRTLRLAGIRVHALKITKQGQPQHPLYLAANTMPFRWPGGEPWSPAQLTEQHP
ncbi:MAG: hypothetical protein RL685_5157 [Pseudomonadota bacterium]|jgi:hypothetical protein